MNPKGRWVNPGSMNLMDWPRSRKTEPSRLTQNCGNEAYNEIFSGRQTEPNCTTSKDLDWTKKTESYSEDWTKLKDMQRLRLNQTIRREEKIDWVLRYDLNLTRVNPKVRQRKSRMNRDVSGACQKSELQGSRQNNRNEPNSKTWGRRDWTGCMIREDEDWTEIPDKEHSSMSRHLWPAKEKEWTISLDSTYCVCTLFCETKQCRVNRWSRGPTIPSEPSSVTQKK